MKRLHIFGLLLLITSALPLLAQDRTPYTTILARAIKRVEPGWRYTYGWCTCPRTVPRQVWRDIGTWERTGKDRKRESVDVWVVLAGSTAESAEWIDRWAHVISHAPDQIESYPLGDEAYLSKGPTTFRRILNCR